MSFPQSTAYTVLLKVYLSSDHVTPATGKTVAVTLSKAGGAFANPSGGATNATEVANGWYSVTLSTTDMGTLGDLVVRGTASGCDDSERLLPVVKATNGGLTALPDAVAGANTGLPVLSSSATTLAYTISTLTTYTGNTVQTGDAYARLGAPAGASIAADLAEIEAETDGIAAIPTNNPTAAAIATQVWSTAVPGAFTSGEAGNVLGNVATGTPPTAAAIAQAVWEDTTAGGDFGTAGSIGLLMVTNINATIGSRSTLTQTQVTGGAYALQTDASGYLKLSSGTGTGQLSFTSGVVQADAATFAGNVPVQTSGKLWVLDGSGNAVAPAGTALSTADYTSARAGYIDNLSGGAVALESEAVLIYNRIGAPVGASISADIAAVKSSVGTPQQTGVAVTLPANPPSGFIVAASIGSGALNGKGDWLLATSAPTHFGALQISAGGIVEGDVYSVNGVRVSGAGTVDSPWGPA